MNHLLNTMAACFDSGTTTPDLSLLNMRFLDELERGNIRCAQNIDAMWQVDERVKKGILLAFRLGTKGQLSVGPMNFIDKTNLWPRSFSVDDQVRVVPFASTIRRGAYLGKNVSVMPPSYVNIGAFIDDESLVDSNALVGSCAQIGKRVHLSAGVQIGGVLEPIGALPVIVEDDALIGGNSGIYEGTRIGKRAVIGAGVVLTKSIKVYDLVKEQIICAEGSDGVLMIPENAVVVPGMRALRGSFASASGLSVSAPVIIKYRDENTDTKIRLEDLLR